MSSELLIHQTLHGYRKGHNLLAASIELPAKTAELIKRLSDLSGLSIEDKFDPYFTAYPVPNTDFYAIGKTWPDLEAARRGCVLTHTLLIPNKLLTKVKFLRSLNSLFSKSLKDLTDYKTPINFNESTNLQISHHLFSVKNGEDFVYKYFYQGVNPIVWWDESFSNDIFWSILETSWAELKQHFACCTYSLQPRSIDNRLFDLMFAPSEVYARFNKIPRDNFINRRSSDELENEDENTRYWVNQLTNAFVYRNPKNSLESSIQAFSDLLSAEPTSIKNVIKVEELKKRVAISPTAAIGLMDLWSTLAPPKQEALHQLQKTVLLAIETAAKEDIEKSLKLLYLISERLEKPYFEYIKQDFFNNIIESVSLLAQKNPSLAISTSERLFADFEQKNRSSYYRGLIYGLSALAKNHSPLLNVLDEFPLAAAVLVTEEPEIAKGYLNASDDYHQQKLAENNLSAWIAFTKKSNKFDKLREFLIPDLSDDRLTLAEQLLKDIKRDELFETLNLISKISHLNEQKELRQIISDQITNIYPSETRTWAGELRNWKSQCSVILADSFEYNLENLEDLLSLPGINNAQKGEVLTFYLLSLGIERFPLWFYDFSSYRADFLIPLMTTELITEETIYLLKLIFTQISEIPVAREPIILKHLSNFLCYEWSDQLVHSSMVSLIKGFISGDIGWNTYQEYYKTDWAVDWLSDSNIEIIKFLCSENIDSYADWKRSWIFLATLPTCFFSLFSSVLPEWIEILTSKRRYGWNWTEEEASNWSQIIRNVSNTQDESIHLQLSSFALNYAFRNNEFPLSKLVVETFWTVYKFLLEKENSDLLSSSLYSIFGWLNWDWDKAKSLRKKLVQSFIMSSWPPGDIVMAIPDQRTLRKVIKRIQDQRNGETYINAILNDLKQRENIKSQDIYYSLNKLLKSEELFEPWY